MDEMNKLKDLPPAEFDAVLGDLLNERLAAQLAGLAEQEPEKPKAKKSSKKD